MSCDASAVLRSLQARALETSDRDEIGRALVETLSETLPNASWIGIYWLENDTLRLGPCIGHEATSVEIPVGHGVCGVAVAESRDLSVPDVHDAGNEFVCAPWARSEMVIVLRSLGKVIGCLDVAGDRVDAFETVDQCILRAVADSFGGLLAGPEETSADGA